MISSIVNDLLCSLKDVADGLGMPLPAARRCDTASIQGRCNVPQGGCAGFLCLSDNGQDVRSVTVSFSLHGGHRATAGHVELGVAEGDTACLSGCKGLPGACADQSALLLGKSGEQVQDKGVNVRAQLCDQEGNLVRHEAADEVNISAQAVQFGDRHVGSLLPRSS